MEEGSWGYLYADFDRVAGRCRAGEGRCPEEEDGD
jgi:hypothetical protein